MKDLIRFLRLDQPENCTVRRQLGRMQTLQKDLLPILVNFHEEDKLLDVSIKSVYFIIVADRHTDRWTDRHTDRKKHEQTDRKTQTDRQTERHKQTDRHTDRQTERHINRQTERHKQTDRKT